MFILLKEMGPWSVGGVDRASSPDALGSEFETHSVRKYHFFNIPRRAQRQISELSEGGRVKPKKEHACMNPNDKFGYKLLSK